MGEIWLGVVGGELFERGVGVRRTCVIKMVFLWVWGDWRVEKWEWVWVFESGRLPWYL